MKKYFSICLIAVMAMGMVGCKQDDPKQPDPIPSSVKRVHLIEHFTGEDCGYCPYGMDCIQELYGANPDNYVWVSNHYGYSTDEYTIAGSETIGKKLSVTSAPDMDLNRARVSYSYQGETGTAMVFHPAYVNYITTSISNTSLTGISIERVYDAATRKLHVTIKGSTADSTLTGVNLTVGVTESGTVGKQKDYYGSWEGWNKFRHTHTIRVYASAALGDAVDFQNHRFTKEYDIDIDSKWVADNCEIVAWVTPASKYVGVLNAAKLPVVEGTKGGEDITHGGVEAVAISESYPEDGAPKASIVANKATGRYYLTSSYSLILLDLQDTKNSVGKYYNQYAMYPYLSLQVLMPAGSKALTAGTYPVVSADKATFNNVMAGYRDDERFSLEYSQLYYVFSYSGSLSVAKQWLISSGELVVGDSTMTLSAKTLNGSEFTLTYDGEVTYSAYTASAPARNRASFPQMKQGALALRPFDLNTWKF